MNSQPKGAKKKQTTRSPMKASKKSALAREAEKVFHFQEGVDVVGDQEHYVEYPQQPVTVRIETFTTYSVCEEPIPNPLKK
jgi:hypothetical protein